MGFYVAKTVGGDMMEAVAEKKTKEPAYGKSVVG